MKKLFVFVPIFLVFTLCAVIFTPFVAMSEDISENVFRLHIIANSDSKFDQDLKLKVRDKVLQYTKDIYSGCKNIDDAVIVSQNNVKLINEVAQKTLAFYGSDYEVKTYVTKEYFTTRYYDDFTLPAGNYNTLKIEIGKAKGHNWWCVMFPSVCLSGCTDDFYNSLSYDEVRLIKSNKYAVRFKAVEIYEKLKNKVQ